MKKILFLLFLFSCANKDEQEREKYYKETEEKYRVIYNAQREKKEKELEELNRKYLPTMQKYHCNVVQAQAILNRSVEIGMSKEMCIGAWGKPYDINTTTTNNTVLEQWVYSLKSYLYFDKHGQLITIQN